MQRDYTVLVDTREQTPLQIPAHMPILDPNKCPSNRVSLTIKLSTQSHKLDTGDYALLGYEKICLVERKGSIQEITKNCLNATDRKRFIASLDRLRKACLYPYVMLEGSLVEMTSDKRVPDWWNAFDSLQRLLFERNIGLILLPNNGTVQRRLVGEWVARLLVNAALSPILPATPSEEPPCHTSNSLQQIDPTSLR